MIDRSKLGLILGAVTAAAVIGGVAGAQTPPPAPAASPAPAAAAPATSPAPAAKACCQGHAGKEGHDHSKCAMHAAGAELDHSKCPMHAEKAKAAGASKCPFMSKKAEEAKPAGSKPEASAGGFVCPMHPEVTSKTKDRCPKCGMFLEEKKS